MYKIAIVEDEKNLNDLISTYLKNENYDITQFYNGESALNYSGKIDLWILDIMLGDNVSGYDLIKTIRDKDTVVPVIFTTARDQELDKIIGFELDADDYLTKPYSPKELVLRVNKIIRRTYSKDFSKLVYDDYLVNVDKRIVLENKKEITLTTLEFDLLLLLLKNKNRSYSREDILNLVWGNEYYGSDRVVDDLVRRVRNKLPKLNINTIYGYGYRLT